MVVMIDENSGFCFGVVNAIAKAEMSLERSSSLYCLGDIVHNTQELQRLASCGLRTITHEQLTSLRNELVLLRAHGEPPETYKLALSNGNRIIDATCPVVLRLQKRIKEAYVQNPLSQIVIYGKLGHAEVNGLVGQTAGNAIVIEGKKDAVLRLDFGRNIILFSQTTMSDDGFRSLVDFISSRVEKGVDFKYVNTICRQVAHRVSLIREFATRFEMVLFVSDGKSSNGNVLFEECRMVNPRTVFVSSEEEVTPLLVKDVNSIGICGATSTPKWLMEQISERIKSF